MTRPDVETLPAIIQAEEIRKKLAPSYEEDQPSPDPGDGGARTNPQPPPATAFQTAQREAEETESVGDSIARKTKAYADKLSDEGKLDRGNR